MDVVNNPKPPLSRRCDKVAEETSTDGAINEQYLHDDQNFKKTTNTKLPTDCIEITKTTLARVFVKVAEEASNDGTTNERYLYEDHNYTKTTSLLHLAQWAQAGCYPSVTLISLWLMARWAR